MSDNIDIPVTADGSGDIDRLTASIDRLHASMSGLGKANPGLSRLSADMKAMTASLTTGLASMQDQLKQTQQTLATGFAAMTNVATQGAANFGAQQERAIKSAGDKAVKAVESNAIKMKEADARTWEQIQRGSASNVTRAFNQLAQGVPVEKVQARLGALATSTATSFNGQLGQLRQFQANSKSLWDTHYKGLAGATEAQMGQAQKMNEQWNASMRIKSAGKVDARTLLGLPSLEEARSAGAQIAAQMRAGVAAESARARAASKIDVRTLLGLPSESEARSAGAQIAAQMRAAVQTENLRAKSAGRVDARTLLGLPSDTEMKSFTSSLKAQMQEHARGEAAIKRSTSAMIQHNTAMHEAHGLARGLAGSLGGLWLTYGSLVPLIAGAAIATSLKNVVTAGKEVEYQLKFVEALGGQSVNLNSFLAVTDGTVVSVKEAAEGMRALAQNGQDVANSLKALPTVLNLAVIGEMGVAEAALAATGAMSAFGLGINDLSYVGDVFAKAAATSNTSVAAMTESMKQASTVASIYNVSIEETAAALGTLAKINVIGSAAGTAYTNMLNGLYAPTNQAAAALKELGVTTDDGAGGLKNSTVLLAELKKALSGFNDPAKADFMSDIFTVRGAKAASTVLSNFDDYKKKIGESADATGMMSNAVAKLEDSTEGASKRLANSLSGAFNKAFAGAQPALQALITDLGTLARTDGVVYTLTTMADAVLRLTRVMFENVDVIAVMAAAYVGLRIISGVTTMLAAYTAGTVAATAATARYAVVARALTSSFGLIGVALGALTLAWQFFIEQTTEVEKADQRVRNSIASNIEWLERETRAYQERNKERNGGGIAETAQKDVNTQVADLQKRVNEGTIQTMLIRDKDGPQGLAYNASNRQLQDDKKALRQALADQEKTDVLTAELSQNKHEEMARNEMDRVKASVKAMVERSETFKTVSGEIVAKELEGNEKSRAAAAKAIDIQKALEAGTMSAAQGKIELLAVQKRYNEALMGRAPKPDKAGASAAERAENEALNVALRRLEQDQTLQRMGAEAAMDEARAQNRRGELGDLQLINLELAKKQEINQMAVDTAKLQYDLADAGEKLVKKQGYEGKKEVAQKQGQIDSGAAVQARRNVLAQMAQDENDYEQRAMAAKGQHVKAFLAGYEADYATTIARIEADMDASTDSMEMYRLMRFMEVQDRMKEAGTDKALGKEIEDSFSATIEKMGLALDSLGDNASPEAGLGAYFRNALAAEQELSAALPALMAKQAEMQALADAPGASDDVKKKAAGQLRDIAALAAEMRGIWVGVGEAISESLEGAFGRAGKAAGAMMNVQIAHAARQKQINEDLNKKKGTKGYEEARIQAIKDLDSAQIQSYANMAGAAKSYFDEGSRGYKALEAVERSFHAMQLAMNLEVMLSKLFSTQVVTTAKVGAAAAEGAAAVGTVPVVLGAEAAKSSAYGVTALAAALAAPFPANIPAFAMVAGMLMAIGVAVSSRGGSASKAPGRQEAAGTGSVFGDLGERQRDGSMKYKDKSDSIAKSLELVSKNTDIALMYDDAMLQSLRAIENNITGLANLAIRGGSLSRADGIATGTLKGASAGNAAFSTGTGAAVGYGLAATFMEFGSIMGPVGAAVGAVVGAVLSKAFKTKQSVTDAGLNIGPQSYGSALSGVSGNTYADVNTKKSFLGISYSNKDKTVNTGALDEEMSRQFSQVITSMGDGIKSALDVFGLGGDAFTERLKTFVIDIGEISTKGLSGAEIEEQFQAVFSKLGDDMALFSIDGLQQFQQIGEGYFETLIRIANDYQAVDAVMASVGKVFATVGTDSIIAREKLIQMSGGLEEFISKSEFFNKNFLSDDERLAPMQASVSKALAPYETNGAITTIDQFAAAVKRFAGDVSDEGMAAYATLMKIAPAFKEIVDAGKARAELEQQIYALTHTAAEALANDRRIELAAMTASLRPLQERIWALEDEKSASEAALGKADDLIAAADDAFSVLQRVVNKEKDRIQTLHDASMKAIDKQIETTQAGIAKIKPLADALNSALEGMRPVNSEKDSRIVAQSQLQSALAIARAGGPLPTADSLKSPLSILTQDSSDLFATMEDYQADFYATQVAMQSLSALANGQLSVEEKILASLETSKEAAIAAFDAEMARLDGILEGAQQQLDVLKGMDITLVTIAGALANFQLAIAAAQANPVVSGTAAITKAYQESLGRSPEAAGLDYWKDQIGKGTPIGSIQDSIKNSSEAKVQELYKSMLGRQGDAGGVDYWTKMVNGGMSIDDVRKAFASSAEYQNPQPASARETNATADRMSAASVNEQLLEELRQARVQAAADAEKTRTMTEAHLFEILKNTRTSADIQDEWNTVGQPGLRDSIVEP